MRSTSSTVPTMPTDTAARKSIVAHQVSSRDSRFAVNSLQIARPRVASRLLLVRQLLHFATREGHPDGRGLDEQGYRGSESDARAHWRHHERDGADRAGRVLVDDIPAPGGRDGTGRQLGGG